MFTVFVEVGPRSFEPEMERTVDGSSRYIDRGRQRFDSCGHVKLRDIARIFSAHVPVSRVVSAVLVSVGDAVPLPVQKPEKSGVELQDHLSRCCFDNRLFHNGLSRRDC
jgi:hypothetical protein